MIIPAIKQVIIQKDNVKTVIPVFLSLIYPMIYVIINLNLCKEEVVLIYYFVYLLHVVNIELF